MSNDRFDDIGVLTILRELQKQGMLHDEDREVLISRLKSEWGKHAARAIAEGDDSKLQDKSVLRRFSEAF